MSKKSELIPVVLNLHYAKTNKLNESFLRMFGGVIKTILKGMFGEGSPIKEENQNNHISVKGTKEEVQSFVDTLSKEKEYIESFLEHGIAGEETKEKKSQLNDSIETFEKTTGLIWPIK